MLDILRYLQSGRFLNSTDLAEACGVTRRTIFRDIKALQNGGLPVTFDEDRQGYSLLGSRLLPPTNLSLDETLALIVLTSGGGESEESSLRVQAKSAALKLLSNLPQKLRASVGVLSDSVTMDLPSHNHRSERHDAFGLLLTAIQANRQIRIHYDSLSDGEGHITTLVNPYHILFKTRSWYVIGRSSVHRAARTFNVGRISKAELLKSKYTMPANFSLDRYLGNAWSLIPERKKRRKVVIRFQPMVAKNVAEVQWHKTQQLKWEDDGTLLFTVTVDGLNEIVWWILGYGDQAEVVQPKELRQKILKSARDMVAQYEA